MAKNSSKDAIHFEAERVTRNMWHVYAFDDEGEECIGIVAASRPCADGGTRWLRGRSQRNVLSLKALLFCTVAARRCSYECL
jgi:hypothetical protein